MTKQAILYDRVSSDEQAERGTSLQSQFAAMREYAAQQGFTVVSELREDYSGAKLSRPALDVARAFLAQHEADVTIVFRRTACLATLPTRLFWVKSGCVTGLSFITVIGASLKTLRKAG